MTVESLLRAGDRALSRGNSDGAGMFYRAAMRTDPGDPRPYRRLEAAMEGPGGVPDRSRDDAADAANAGDLLDRARSALKAGRIASARETYREAIALTPSARGYSGLGVALALDGRPDEAETAFREALAIDPAHAASRTNLALNLALAGRHPEALALMSETPRAAGTRHRSNLALIHVLAGDVARAAALIEADVAEERQLRRQIAFFRWLGQQPPEAAAAALAGLRRPPEAAIAALMHHAALGRPQSASADIAFSATAPEPPPAAPSGPPAPRAPADSAEAKDVAPAKPALKGPFPADALVAVDPADAPPAVATLANAPETHAARDESRGEAPEPAPHAESARTLDAESSAGAVGAAPKGDSTDPKPGARALPGNAAADSAADSRSETAAKSARKTDPAPVTSPHPAGPIETADSNGPDSPDLVSPPPLETVTVEAGDTLWAIAARHYGNGLRYHEIFRANRAWLSSPDLILPGQVLDLPVIDDVTTASAGSAAAPSVPPPAPGDSPLAGGADPPAVTLAPPSIPDVPI